MQVLQLRLNNYTIIFKIILDFTEYFMISSILNSYYFTMIYIMSINFSKFILHLINALSTEF
jgi:hypothetical protein